MKSKTKSKSFNSSVTRKSNLKYKHLHNPKFYKK